MAAYRLMSEKSDYPFTPRRHRDGDLRIGTIKSAIGIGGLLSFGIGDTIQVSLSADPVEEVSAARDILKALGIRQDGPNLISCPYLRTYPHRPDPVGPGSGTAAGAWQNR